MLTDAQVRRYARHILLPEVGGRGQERLLAARCTVAVGPERAAETCALLYLAAAGVGTIGLAGELDGAVTADEQRGQPIYTTADVGRPRGAAIALRVAALDPDIRVVPAATLAGTAPALAIDPTPWLDGAPAVAAALVRGSAAACRLLATLVRP
jgi:adenylyltransferase/sulfurtransferase